MTRRQKAAAIAGLAAFLGALAWLRRLRRLRRASAAALRFRGSSQVIFIRHGESTVNARQRLYRQQGAAAPGEAYFEPEFVDMDDGGDGGGGGGTRRQPRRVPVLVKPRTSIFFCFASGGI